VRTYFLKIEAALPAFAGVLGSMFVCALIAVHGPGKLARAQSVLVENAGEPDSPDLPVQSIQAAFLSPLPKPEGDRILEFYRDLDYRDQVVEFFTSLCGSRNVAAVVLANASAFEVPPSLAFALCWEESRYRPLAVNRKNRDESVDRGLFQLNSRSFPNIPELDFFNPSINAWYGMGHLRLCLDTGGTEIAALAMYNAGTGRVRSLGAPKNTLDYIHRILEGRQKIERLFAADFSRREEFTVADRGDPEEAGPGQAGLTPAIASAKPPRPWLVHLAPLSGNR
jgi:hypothetical protein